MRRTCRPISLSALETSARSGCASSASAAPKLSRLANALQAAPVGLTRPNCWTASLAWARNCSSVSA